MFPDGRKFIPAAAPNPAPNFLALSKKRLNPSIINTSRYFALFCNSLIINDFKPPRINTSGNKDLKSIRINTSGAKDLKSFRINTSKKHGRGTLYFVGSLFDDPISASNFCISGWIRVFDATMSASPGRCGAAPANRVTVPPASPTSNAPAAVSHDFSPNSQKPSNRPQATEAKSNAADPSRRTP